MTTPEISVNQLTDLAGTSPTEDFVLTSSQAATAETKLGRLTRLKLTQLGSRPYSCVEVQDAWWSLRSTYATVDGLFDTLYLVRETRSKEVNREARRLTQEAQELLRAAIVFTSAGLDACLKELLKGALPLLVVGNKGAQKKYKTFITGQLNMPKVDDGFRRALLKPNPGEAMLNYYLESLKAGSFQKTSQIEKRVQAALGITEDQVSKDQIEAIGEFLQARNQVAHEMDQLSSRAIDSRPRRRDRSQDKTGKMCDEAFQLAADLIRATAKNIQGCPSEAS